MTYGRIVVGVAGAEASPEALAVAVSLARDGSADLIVVDAGSEKQSVDLEAIRSSLEPDRLMVLTRHGHPQHVLAEVAEEVDAGLIVVGRGGVAPTHTAMRLAHMAPCDLLVVAEDPHDRAHPYGRILIGSDGSATADRAARRAFDLARSCGATVELVFVGHRATGELITRDTISSLGDDVPTEVHLLEGDPALRIAETAASSKADLIVVGNKGLTGLRGRVLGSVPQGVLETSNRDLLVSRTIRQVESELQPGEGGVIERHGEQLAAWMDETRELHLMSARCTHLGCIVAWNPTERTFDCPCHDSRFGTSGEVLQGPAARPLPPA